MRADRLISIIMLLQTHGKMTAGELSRRLEVTVRTIYRDVTALNVAGIPIYTDRGPGGGIGLLESYRTTLTGLSEAEVRAFSMLNIPEPLVKLGVAHQLKSALLKLAAALPASQQGLGVTAQQRIYLDTAPWTPTEEPLKLFSVIQQAIWGGSLIWIRFRGRFDSELELELFPMGLVSKGNIWYLVGKCGEHMRVIEVKDILEARILDLACERDENFDLIRFWQGWCKEYNERRPAYWARVKIAPEATSKLSLYFGEDVKIQLNDREPPDKRGWITMSIQFEHFFQAREKLLSLGMAVEILEPEPLRLSVIDFAKQIVEYYRNVSPKR